MLRIEETNERLLEVLLGNEQSLREQVDYIDRLSEAAWEGLDKEGKDLNEDEWKEILLTVNRIAEARAVFIMATSSCAAFRARHGVLTDAEKESVRAFTGDTGGA